MTRLSTRFIHALAGSAVLLIGGATASAHHSFAAEYDGNKPITLTGPITKMLWSSTLR